MNGRPPEQHSHDPTGQASEPRPEHRRVTPGERQWPTVLAVAAAITLQVVLPDRLILHPRWLLPGVELALMVALTVTNPVRVVRAHPVLRLAALALVAAVTAVNAGSACCSSTDCSPDGPAAPPLR